MIYTFISTLSVRMWGYEAMIQVLSTVDFIVSIRKVRVFVKNVPKILITAIPLV